MMKHLLMSFLIGCCCIASAQITSSSFESAVTFSSGSNSSSNPQFMETGDLDGDGKPEIVVPNTGSGSISVFQNNTTAGSITTSSLSKTDFTTLSTLDKTALADIDGDGKSDVVVSYGGSSTPSNFSVFRNTSSSGSVSFATRSDISCAGGGATLADIDGDGKTDVILVDFFSNYIRIYRNTSSSGSVSFSSAISYSSGTSPAMTTVKDFDGDGKPDIAVTNYLGSGAVKVFLNTSTSGSISLSSTVVTLTAGSFANGITSGDVDGDGKIDIVAANYSGGTISVYRNTSTSGSLSFSSQQTFSTTGSNGPQRMALTDFDLDGRADLMVSNRNNNTLSVFRNYSISGTIDSYTFLERKDYSVGSVPFGVVDDIDGDGKPDLVSANASDGTICIRRNKIVPSNGLVAYYPFSGNAGDSSGFENHGTASSGASLTTNRKAQSSKAYHFDASTSAYIDAAASGSLNTKNMKNCFLSCWVNIGSSVTNDRRLINIQDGSNRNYDISYTFSSRRINFVNWNGSSSSVTLISKTIVNPGGWYHVAVRIDSANNTHLFINGILDTFSTNTVTKPINPSLCIGRHKTNNWNLSGDLDEVRVYNRYVTNTEITALYNDGVTDGLIAYYPFSGNAGDSSGLNNHGTVTGASLTTDRFGNANSAYSFNGTSNLISLSPINYLLNNYTYSVWINPNSTTPAAQSLFSVGTSSSDQFMMLSNSSSPSSHGFTYGSYYSTSSTSGVNSYNTGSLPTTGTWYHLALTRSIDSLKLYINGTLVDSRPISGFNAAFGSSGYETIIGARVGSVRQWFDGKIDEVRIYNRPLSLSEIQQLADIQQTRHYYSNATGYLDSLSTWGTNVDGSGTHPLSFDSSDTYYHVVNNASPTISDNWFITGTNTGIIFGDGINTINSTIPSGLIMGSDSIFVRNYVTLTFDGDVYANKLNLEDGSTIQYVASGTQTILPLSYYNLVVSGDTKTLSGTTAVRGTLAMLADIDCSSNTLTLGISASNTGTLSYSSGKIIGSFSRWFGASTNSGGTGLFPIGTSSEYYPFQVEYTTAPTTGGLLTVSFNSPTGGTNRFSSVFDFSVSPTVKVNKVSNDGCWTLTPSGGLTGGTYTVTATANGFGGISSISSLRLIRRNSSSSAWALTGTAVTVSGTTSSPVVARSGVAAATAARDFGIGSDSATNILPVRLIRFDAKQVNNADVLLSWTTAMEVNNDYFEVEKLINNQYVSVGRVKGQNMQQLDNYSLADLHAFDKANTVYYRLKQVDRNGIYTYSDVVSVTNQKQVEIPFMVYPNPANTSIWIKGIKETTAIRDIVGNEIMTIDGEGEVDITSLPKGIYFIQSGNQIQKLIKY